MKIMSQTLTVATLCGAILVATAGSALAADERSNSDSGLKLTRRTPDDKKQLTADEMLSDLRDLRLSLGQVKQQAVNLFLESTRVVIKATDPPVPTSPTLIKAATINKKTRYLPPRKEWLVFYVNTLEPTIQMLMDDIHDVDTNGRNCPKALESQTDPLWQSWKSEVNHIKKSLDQVQELIEPESGTNVALANAACAIFNKATELEKTRVKVYLIMQKHYLAEAKSGKKG